MNSKTNPFIKYVIFSLPLSLLVIYVLSIGEMKYVEIDAGPSTMISNDGYNFIAAGDYYCNDETIKTINNMIKLDPELVITTGDHVKYNMTADCWFDISSPIGDKLRIAIGNHDMDYSSRYQQLMDHYQLSSPYYSYNFQNIHFLSLSTEHPYQIGSKQYEFIVKDLEQVSKNKSIDWIIVHQHKPFYSTKQDKSIADELRDTYLQLFEKYDVDLVLSSHNQYYERTYPIVYNPTAEYQLVKSQDDDDDDDDDDDNKPAKPDPIIINGNKYFYPTAKGTIFLTVGTGGQALDPVKETPDYYVVQKSAFGFLDIQLENNGTSLVGSFHANNGSVLDRFELIEKTVW